MKLLHILTIDVNEYYIILCRVLHNDAFYLSSRILLLLLCNSIVYVNYYVILIIK